MRQKDNISGEVNPIVDCYKKLTEDTSKHLYKEKLRLRIRVNREALMQIKTIEQKK